MAPKTDLFWTELELESRAIIEDWEFIYFQSTGNFCIGTTERISNDLIATFALHIDRGYSGRGVELNDPASDHIVGRGPIPRGRWHLSPAATHRDLGPTAIRLTRDQDTNAKGRSGFYIHGDNKSGNMTASSGCIILPLRVRAWIDAMRAQQPVTRRLTVLA